MNPVLEKTLETLGLSSGASPKNQEQWRLLLGSLNQAFDTYNPAKQEISTSQATKPNGPKTILLVDDEPVLLEVFSEILSENNYIVTAVNSPEEALSLAVEQNFDLLLTDVVMPGMNGTKLAKELQSMCPNLKVIFMSGYAIDSITDFEIKDLKRIFIQKPFSTHDLIQKITTVFNEAK